MISTINNADVVELNVENAHNLWSVASALGATASLTPDEFSNTAMCAVPAIPENALRRIHQLRSDARYDVVLLRGVLPGTVDVPRTPTSTYDDPDSETIWRAKTCLLAIALCLGEPFNFATLYGGQLVHSLVPSQAMEDTQTGESSGVTLGWHVEDGFTEARCDYIGLLCLRSEPAAMTTLARARELVLSQVAEEVLREPRFEMRPDSSPLHDTNDVPSAILPVLTGRADAPEICFDQYLLGPSDSSDRAAARALDELHRSLDRAAIGCTLEFGDLLLINNRRVAHGRTVFPARFDGTDRWLLRTMICGSAREFQRHGTRILQ